MGPARMAGIEAMYSSFRSFTPAIATAAATAQLNLLKGRLEQLSWEHVVNPQLAPLQVVGVTAADGTVSRYIIDDVVTPLKWDGVQTAITRTANGQG